jgi:eukaryotic-like serine/threonine-protein kinase
MSMIGRTLGHYKIGDQPLGKGGMGEVYRAKDQKLGRDVAIKVLPEEFAREADRVARFQREAKLLASLNHPNIAAIYGLEESGGTNFLVLELVEGETLAERIKAGTISVEESLKLALQIAEALEAAHEKGVIHRDLKPANIKVTPEGKVKVLDFGLAKAFAGDQQEETLTHSPTLSELATQRGVILGTAAYMSPEQAKGKTVDKRADIWAFGAVLFEMLTGKQLFSGETISEILASVLKSEPEWNRLPPNLHPRLRLLLERCLEKESKNRYHDIADVRVDIQKVLADPGGVFVQPVTAVKPRRSLRLGFPWLAAAVVLTAIIAGLATWKLKPSEPGYRIRFDYNLPESQQFSALPLQALAVSPDGKQFVYSTYNGLYIRPVDQLTAKLIAGTEGRTSNPFFSPDGKWIGYFSSGKLKKIAVNGGAPVELCNTPQLPGACWNEDDTIVFADGQSGGIMRISANGGTPESIGKLKSGNLIHPQILPDGQWILYTPDPKNAQPKIMAYSLKSGETRELFPGFDAHYVSTGHIIYRLPQNSSLYTIPFNPSSLEVKGVSVPVLESVMQYAISDSGTLVYMPRTSGGAAAGRILVWVNRDGKEERLSATPNDYLTFRISPDGKRVALTVLASPKANIWIWDVNREDLTRLTLDEGTTNTDPLWTLDGKRIVFHLQRGEDTFWGDIYWKAADGTGKAEKLASTQDRGLYPWSWSKDGRNLVLVEFTGQPQQWDIGMLSMEGDHTRKPLLQERYFEKDPRISNDGRWMAYASNESGEFEVYVRPFPDVNKNKWKVSTGGGNSPLWSPDGRELFYRNGDDAMAVRVETEPAFKAGKPAVLFRGAFPRFAGKDFTDFTWWDISPDGKRFLILRDAEVPRKIDIVVNWLEELKQKMPAQ